MYLFIYYGERCLFIIVRLNLYSNNVRNCKETMFVKERNPQFGI